MKAQALKGTRSRQMRVPVLKGVQRVRSRRLQMMRPLRRVQMMRLLRRVQNYQTR